MLFDREKLELGLFSMKVNLPFVSSLSVAVRIPTIWRKREGEEGRKTELAKNIIKNKGIDW